MKYSIIKILVLGVAMVSLAACSSFGSHAKSGQGATAGEGSAYTSGVGTGADFQGTNTALVAPHDQTYHFAFDSDVVKADDMASINAQANYLVAHHNARVRLEGNTDERGSREYNVGLGWRRAKAVKAMLRQEGVAPKQIVTISYGEEKPVAFGHNEASWKLNRRVELVYEVK